MPTNQPAMYGAFDSPKRACGAVGALLDAGVDPGRIRVILNESERQSRVQDEEERLDYSHPTTLVRDHDALNTLDPFNNEMRDTPITIEPSRNLHDLGPGHELLAYDTVQPDFPHDEAEERADAPTLEPHWSKPFSTLAQHGSVAIPGLAIILGAKHPGDFDSKGGFSHLLAEVGLPPVDIPTFRRAIEERGAVVVVEMAEGSDRTSIEQHMKQNGASCTSAPGYLA